MSIKVLDNNGLLYVWNKIKTLLSNKVDKELKTGSTSAYKVLSDNNLTDELLNKINNAGDSSFSGNYEDLNNKPIIPTNNNQLTNGAGYQTSSDVQTAINNALSGITGIDFQVVTELPTTAVKGTIYLLSNSGTGNNIYDEYIWLTDKFEKIGTTEVDLSGYLQSSDLVEITNDEMDSICV